jgi:hypothetical protein
MTARRLTYPTGRSIGGYQVVTFRHTRGFAILAPDGTAAYTSAHPVTGRPRPALLPTMREALTVAEEISRG